MARSAEVELTSLDSPHLRLDAAAHPTNWVLVLELSPDGEPIRIDDVRARIAQRLHESELYRLMLPQHTRRKPWFTVATAIDPTAQANERHVADRDGMLGHVEELMRTQMRRDAPLWDFTLIHHHDTGNQTLLLRVHHALSDGLGAPAFVALLADTASGSTAEYRRFLGPRRFEPGSVGVSAALGAWTRSLRMSTRGGRRRGSARPVGDRAARRVAEFVVPTRTLRRNRLELGASTQEFVLAAAGFAFMRAFPEHNDRPLRVMFSVSLDRSPAHVGNAASPAAIDLPRPADSLREHLHDVQAALRSSDIVRQAMDVPAISRGISILPWRTQALLSRLMVADSWDLAIGVNPAFSPEDRLMGRAVTNVVGFPPVLGRAITVSALTLRDRVTVAMVADPEAVPDLGLFAKHLRGLTAGQP